MHTESNPFRLRAFSAGAFTLIELLVVVAIIAALIGILLPSLSAAREAARASACLSNGRQMAMAMQMYADQSERNVYPTAGMMGHTPWMELLRPYIDAPKFYRCPSDRSEKWEGDEPAAPGVTSYGLNAYFTPNHPPYHGMNAVSVKRPSRTVLIGEAAYQEYKIDKDHIMPMFWGDPPVVSGMMAGMARPHEWDSDTHRPKSLAFERHGGAANYAFADGHAATHPFTDTWEQAAGQPPSVDWYDPLGEE